MLWVTWYRSSILGVRNESLAGNTTALGETSQNAGEGIETNGTHEGQGKDSQAKDTGGQAESRGSDATGGTGQASGSGSQGGDGNDPPGGNGPHRGSNGPDGNETLSDNESDDEDSQEQMEGREGTGDTVEDTENACHGGSSTSGGKAGTKGSDARPLDSGIDPRSHGGSERDHSSPRARTSEVESVDDAITVGEQQPTPARSRAYGSGRGFADDEPPPQYHGMAVMGDTNPHHPPAYVTNTPTIRPESQAGFVFQSAEQPTMATRQQTSSVSEFLKSTGHEDPRPGSSNYSIGHSLNRPRNPVPNPRPRERDGSQPSRRKVAFADQVPPSGTRGSRLGPPSSRRTRLRNWGRDKISKMKSWFRKRRGEE